MSHRQIDIGQLVDEKKISAFHIQVIGLCFLLLWVDGFDITNASYAGPGLVREFHVSPTLLGTLFSAGLIAGLIGTPIFGMLADRFGRKKVVIGGSLFFGLFTLLPIIATSFNQIILLRFIASIGVAGILPSTVALASEFAPRKYRATMVIVMFTGSCIGGVTVGLVAAQFVPEFGWRVLFWLGGVGPILLAIITIFLLPESIRYLTTHARHRAELVKITRRLAPEIAIDQETSFIDQETSSKESQTALQKKTRFADLFAGDLAILTPLFWIANLVSLVVMYFAVSWLPTILIKTVSGPSHAALITCLFTLSGAIGGLLIMRPLDRFGFLPIPIVFFASVPPLVAIGIPGLSIPIFLAAVIVAGLGSYALQFGLIAMEGVLYPPALRGRGIGLCFAAARVGAGLGPFLGGVLLSHHVDNQTLFIVFAGFLAFGGVVTSFITPLYTKHVAETADKAVAQSSGTPTAAVRA
jgi:MFS transporter, AAHS family, 4-hydroxybenzoate transporter